jgi:hypothetical protein
MNITEHPHPAQHDPQQIGENEAASNEGAHTPDSHEGDEGEFGGKKGTTDEKKTGRRKINIEFIEDKSRRHITFSKRKAGIMKKAYELSTLTGTQVLLLVASETGHVYTFATPKLQPLITKPEGKNLIQSCLNAPEVAPVAPPPQHHAPRIQGGYGNEPPIMYPTSELREPPMEAVYDDEKKQETKSSYPPLGMDMNYPGASAAYQSSNLMPPYGMPSMVGSSGLPRGYMGGQYAQAPHAQYPTSGQVQGQYQQAQAQYGASGYAANPMHGLSSWPKQGMAGVPIGQGQTSQQQQSSISGLIQPSKQGEHSADHST